MELAEARDGGFAWGDGLPDRMEIYLRLAEPESVATIPVDPFDGLNTFEDLPRSGRCVADYWF